MSFETPAIVTSIVMISVSILTFVLNGRSTRPGKSRTLTITIEDSAGGRARTVTRSDRRADDVKRDVERLVGQTS
ncbi:MAG TPA: hypothetical protein VGC13_30345 [Longimicrobium sp.]|jgi:hypothetical protein|uniref:hypothetical protein n=1 Tax=Longimicrobium sp. TaxID=2029185 RepID=UPI002ED9C626